MLDHFLRELIENNVYMGGKWVVLVRDLRQCPPVVTENGSRAVIMSASIMNSDA